MRACVRWQNDIIALAKAIKHVPADLFGMKQTTTLTLRIYTFSLPNKAV